MSFRKSFPRGEICPESCPCVKNRSIDDGSEEGLFAQICPNPDKLGQLATGTVWCGDSPDQVLIFAAEFPSDEEIKAIAQETLWE